MKVRFHSAYKTFISGEITEMSRQEYEKVKTYCVPMPEEIARAEPLENQEGQGKTVLNKKERKGGNKNV
jgi:hypothetical protein